MCVCVCVHIDEKVAAFSKRDESNLRSIVKLALSKERSMQFLLAPPRVAATGFDRNSTSRL